MHSFKIMMIKELLQCYYMLYYIYSALKLFLWVRVSYCTRQWNTPGADKWCVTMLHALMWPHTASIHNSFHMYACTHSYLRFFSWILYIHVFLYTSHKPHSIEIARKITDSNRTVNISWKCFQYPTLLTVIGATDIFSYIKIK